MTIDNAEKQRRYRAHRHQIGMPLRRGDKSNYHAVILRRLQQVVGPPIDPYDYSNPLSDVRMAP